MPFGNGIMDRTGPGMRQVVGLVWESVHGKGYFWGRIWGAPLYPMGTLRRTCATVPQPSGVVRAVGRGIAVLHGVHVVQGKGEVLGVFVPHFHSGKCH